MERLLVDLALILCCGVGSQWLAWRLKVPALMFYLVFGLLLGPFTGWLHTSRIPEGLLNPFISLSVAVILFEGSLNLNFKDLQQHGRVIGRLLSVGLVSTTVGIAVAAKWVLGFEWKLAVLLGAILAVTGPTAILPLLQHARMKKSLAAILRWEALGIDPLGALLAILIYRSIQFGDAHLAAFGFAWGLVKTVVIGGSLGWLAAYGLTLMMRRFWIGYSLQGTGTLTVVAAVFALAVYWQDEAMGFFAVTVMGMTLANQRQVSIQHIVEFKEHLSLLLIPALFILLASQLSLAQVLALRGSGLVFLLLLLLVARPASVLLSTWRSDLAWQERLFLAGMAPRGIVAAAVASVFALRLGHLGFVEAERLVPVTILVVIGTVAVYSLSAGPWARWLGVSGKDQRGILLFGINRLSLLLGKELRNAGRNVVMVDARPEAVETAWQQDLTAIAGDIFSETVTEHPEVGETGHFLALTSNDEANSLAVLHYQKRFEQAHLYQLPPKHAPAEAATDRAGQPPRGRFLFGTTATWDYLDGQLELGAQGFWRRQSHHDPRGTSVSTGGAWMALLTLTDRGEMVFHTVDAPWEPKPGQRTLGLLMPAKKQVSWVQHLRQEWQAAAGRFWPFRKPGT